jgi:hypothetical protein
VKIPGWPLFYLAVLRCPRWERPQAAGNDRNLSETLAFATHTLQTNAELGVAKWILQQPIEAAAQDIRRLILCSIWGGNQVIKERQTENKKKNKQERDMVGLESNFFGAAWMLQIPRARVRWPAAAHWWTAPKMKPRRHCSAFSTISWKHFGLLNFAHSMYVEVLN